jgi:hypothetical protein
MHSLHCMKTSPCLSCSQRFSYSQDSCNKGLIRKCRVTRGYFVVRRDMEQGGTLGTIKVARGASPRRGREANTCVLCTIHLWLPSMTSIWRSLHPDVGVCSLLMHRHAVTGSSDPIEWFGLIATALYHVSSGSQGTFNSTQQRSRSLDVYRSSTG